jgi:hypothetical protein
MPSRRSNVTMRGGDDLRRISKELRAVDDKTLKKQFSKELRAAAKPLVPITRKAIRAIPSSRAYSAAGLRGRLSKAVKAEVRVSGKEAGVRIRVDGRKMATKQGSLPAFMEGTKKPWRHPVYGNTNAWVSQGPSPYFYKALRPKAGPLARKAVNRVVADVSKKIT